MASENKKDSISFIAIIILATKILGFIKLRAFAQLFGLGKELDIFWAAVAIPDTIFTVLITGSINASIFPIFSNVLHQKDDKSLFRLFNKLVLLSSLSMALIITILWLLAPALSSLFTSNSPLRWLFGASSQLNSQDMDLMVKLTRIMLFSPFLLGLSTILTVYLQVHKKFFITTLASFFYNVVMVSMSYVLVKYFHFGVSALAWSVVFGSLMHLLVQLPAFITHIRLHNLQNEGLLGTIVGKASYEELWGIVKLSLPRVFALLGEQVNVVIDTMISFTLSNGALSAYRFASSLYVFPVHIIGGAISTVALSSLAELYAKKNYTEFRNYFNIAVQRTLYVMLPIVSILLILRLPIVRLTLGVGKFDWQDTIITSWCLAFLSFAIIGQVLAGIALRAFYAIHETKLPLFATGIVIVVNAFASYYFTNFFSNYLDWRPILYSLVGQFLQSDGGYAVTFKSIFSDLIRWATVRSDYDFAVGGVALSLSLAFTVEMLLYFMLLNRKVRVVTWKDTVRPALIKLLNAGLMAFGMYWIFKITDFSLDTSRTFYIFVILIVTSGYGALSYILGSKVLGISEISMINERVQPIIVRIRKFVRLS